MDENQMRKIAAEEAARVFCGALQDAALVDLGQDQGKSVAAEIHANAQKIGSELTIRESWKLRLAVAEYIHDHFRDVSGEAIAALVTAVTKES